MIYDPEIVKVSKNWDLRLRVLKHAALHQLTLMQWVLDANHPLVKEYKMFSFDAVSAFLNGKARSAFINDLDVADVALDALLRAVEESLDKDSDKDLRFTGGTESFVNRTYLCITAMALNETLPSFSEKEIDKYLDDLIIDEKEPLIFSMELLKYTTHLGERSVDLITSFLLANPETSEEFKKITYALGERDGEPMIKPEQPRYCLIDRMKLDQTLDRISNQEGPYGAVNGTIVSSFYSPAPYWIDPTDPSTYYIKRIRNTFKTIEQRSSGDEEELKAIQYSLKSWIGLALKNFSESNPVRALYIISAELTEFTKGLSQGVMGKALEDHPSVRENVRIFLQDALSLTLYFMEYVPDQAYNKVSKRLNRFIRDNKEKVDGLVDFKPFVDYLNKRSKIVDQSLN